MFGLGDTLAGLAAIKKSFSTATAGLGGDGALATVRDFGPNPGALKMLIHVPEDLRKGSALVVVLHGCTQGAADHASAAGWLDLADQYGFAVLAPEQTAANNPNRCFNWFEPGDTARGAGEAASIHAMIARAIKDHGLEAQKVFVTGLSAGGAMTAAMLATYPETFAGGAVVAGLPYGAAQTVQQALSTMRQATTLGGPDLKTLVERAAPTPAHWPRLTVWHGAADMTVSPGNAAALARQWTALLNLPPQPTKVDVDGRVTSQRWLDESGVLRVEVNTVAGLGHGMPLSTGGDDGIGHAAPFMIETGVSSALAIAQFWDLVPAQTHASEPRLQSPRPSKAGYATVPSSSVGHDVLAALSNRVPAKVTKVINDALTAAGVMK